jgi:peptidyl-prolyl cis-trans isomerase SurA
MKNKPRLSLIIAIILFSTVYTASSQVLVESIAALVGNEVLYLSDLENQIADIRRNGNKTPVEELRCNILNQMLITKLFLDQARIDSVIVGEDEVEGDLNMRMNEAIRQAKGEENLEKYFNKSMAEIRKDIRKTMIEQETARQIQSTLAEKISVTPSALKRFYSSIPKDSLPVIPAKYELSIIQVDPPKNEDNKAEARQKLLDLRSQILAGKSFNVLAVLNSDDEGSAKLGGEIGYMARNELEKEYSEAAFSLTKNTVSKIIETKYGYHIIQLIDRKGEMVNTRHILIRPKVKPDQALLAISKLDSLANLIRKDSIKFTEAAMRYSTHKDSRINGGKFVSPNPNDRTSWFTLEELNPEMYVKVRDLKVGEISEPFRTTDDDNNVVFRIVRLDNELSAHTANLKDDYQSLYNAALLNERKKVLEKWVKDKIEITYIKISEELKSCKFLQAGWLK